MTAVSDRIQPDDSLLADGSDQARLQAGMHPGLQLNLLELQKIFTCHLVKHKILILIHWVVSKCIQLCWNNQIHIAKCLRISFKHLFGSEAVQQGLAIRLRHHYYMIEQVKIGHFN